MTNAPHVIGYGPSVYTRAVRMALVLKQVAYDYSEIDPFEPNQADTLGQIHPFHKVPVIEHRGFRLSETQAILDYIDGVFPGLALMPQDVLARARARQVMCITDAYLYRPLITQAFSHGVFRPLVGEAFDPAEVHAGLIEAPRVLDALEEIAAEGQVLTTGCLSLADCLLWPMMDYFAMLPEGRQMMTQRSALWAWAQWIGETHVAEVTRPELAGDNVS